MSPQKKPRISLAFFVLWIPYGRHSPIGLEPFGLAQNTVVGTADHADTGEIRHDRDVSVHRYVFVVGIIDTQGRYVDAVGIGRDAIDKGLGGKLIFRLLGIFGATAATANTHDLRLNDR